MNENKKGKPFKFPESFILVIGYIRYLFQSTLQTNRVIKATGKRLPAKSTMLWSYLQKNQQIKSKGGKG